MKRHLRFLLRLAPLLVLSEAQAQSLRFFARPVETFEGGALVFNVRNDAPGTIPLNTIQAWRWDFDGDGKWDETKSVGEANEATGQPVTVREINTTWYATFNQATASNGVQTIRPKLQVQQPGDPAFGSDDTYAYYTQDGITENTVGPDDGLPDPFLYIKDRSAGNADVSLSFSANPKLARSNLSFPVVAAGDTVRLYSSLKPAADRKLISSTFLWTITNTSNGATTTSHQANPALPPLDPWFPVDSYDISLTATYTVTFRNAAGQETTASGVITEEKADAFRVAIVNSSLQSGRAYRRGFPETLGWEDIAEAYQAAGTGGNRYVYFNHFEDAFFNQQSALVGDSANPEKRTEMAEIVNELLQGQLMIANQRLSDALRIKYPRLAATADTTDRLEPPAGAREETAAIDTALLDCALPIHYAGLAIQLYGLDILRNKAPEGSEPFPQFPQYLTFLDPSLSQTPVPVKNELWQLATAIGRMCLGRVEKAKRLYRLSAQDRTALPEAKQETKVAALHSYLGMAVMAAAQDEKSFQLNEGNDLLAHQKNSRDLFERINAGLNPLGNDGSFIPNESFTAVFNDAREAVADAREAEINARQEDRNYDRNQADLRNEQQNQRASFITPLRNLTSIDPASYNDLKTVDDQADYRAAVQGRIDALLQDYPAANARILGEMGSNVISVLDAAAGVNMAKNDLQNLFKRVDIAKWAGKQINNRIVVDSTALGLLDVAMATADAMMTLTAGTSATVANPAGGILKGVSQVASRIIQTAQQTALNDINLDKEVRTTLLEAGNRGLAIERSVNTLNQARLALDNQISRMDRMIEDLAHARDTAADLYFQDPSFRIVVSQAMRRAEGELDYAIDRLFRLAKTLQYEWTEPYQNPLIIPVNSQEPASLENPLFAKFTQLDSLFFVRSADEAKDYLDALKAWDSKLRRINVVSVRGPNHSGPITAEPISLRETILNMRPDASRGYTLEHSIRDFRNFLETKRVAGFYNTSNPSLEIPFATTIEDNTFFPATGSRWNMRIASIAVDLYAESSFSQKQVAEIDLIQSGIVSLRRFWANPPLADDLTRLTFNVDNINRTAFAVALPARINGATGGRPLTEFDNTGLANRPVAATNWILRINTENPTNRDIDFSRIKDIVIRFTYTFGNPPEFNDF